MDVNTQHLIDGLFDRLKTAEDQSIPRDTKAEHYIAQLMQTHTAAPYYMAQSLLIQEAAIKQLSDQLQALQKEQHRTCFLKKLFPGSNNNRNTQATPRHIQPMVIDRDIPSEPSVHRASTSDENFMSSALQTATVVAGGVVIGNMLQNMFSNTPPEALMEMVNAAPEPAADTVESTTPSDDSYSVHDIVTPTYETYVDTSWSDWGGDSGGGADD